MVVYLSFFHVAQWYIFTAHCQWISYKKYLTVRELQACKGGIKAWNGLIGFWRHVYDYCRYRIYKWSIYFGIIYAKPAVQTREWYLSSNLTLFMAKKVTSVFPTMPKYLFWISTKTLAILYLLIGRVSFNVNKAFIFTFQTSNNQNCSCVINKCDIEHY